MRGFKKPFAAVVVTAACGACTSILGDFGTSGGPGDGGSPPMDSTALSSREGGGPDGTLATGNDGASPGDDSSFPDAPFDDDAGEGSAPVYGADASCDGGPCVNAIACNGDHTCAVMSDQTLTCWGNNDYGQSIWNSGTTTVQTPTTVTGIGPVKTARLGDRFTCALLVDESVWCWGDNTYGQIGLPDAGLTAGATYPVPPTRVFPPGSVSILYTGAYHACAQLESSGTTPTVVCWGRNLFGEVGVADASIVAPPVTLPITDFDRMTLGAFETCAVRTAAPFGECIGENEYGELGRGIPSGSDASGIDDLSHPAPAAVQIGALGNYGNFPHATGFHEGVTLANGTVAMWGDNSLGQLGPQVDASATPTPTLMTTISDVQTLALLQYSSCALRTDGTVLCWGSTSSGQNGNTATLGPIQAVPTPITGVTNATGLSSGLNHACALLADGTVACWGDNTSFQLGRSNTTAAYSATPVLVQF